MNSAAGAPAAATTTPAIAGPSMNVAGEGDVERRVRLPLGRLRERLADPCRPPLGVSNRTCACSRAARAVSARSSALVASAAVPSSATSSRIAGSQKCQSSTASSAVAMPSNTYSPLSTPRRGEASTRAASAGAANAGSACPEISSAATASALCVWSKTATDRATSRTRCPAG